MFDFLNRALDKTRRLGAGPALITLAALLACASAAASSPSWQQRLDQKLQQIDQMHGGQLGVYVKDLQSGVSSSLRADENWYLASGIKVPVAIEVLRQVEAGRFALDTQVHLVESDYVDGAGPTNWHGPGTQLTVSYLLEQMLAVSDNTATDMLIRLVGIERVNALVRDLVPDGFGAITTLADVRRHAYSGFHPAAFSLTGKDFFVLKKQSDERRRLQALADLLNVTIDEFALGDLDSAFAAYYATNLNGGRLSAYGRLLEALVDGKALGPTHTEYLLTLLRQVKTGDARIKAGLPKGVAFAHKTGTQHLRTCDLGVALPAEVNEQGRDRVVLQKVATDSFPMRRGVVIAACSRGFRSVGNAEAALRDVAQAVAESGVLEALSQDKNVVISRSDD